MNNLKPILGIAIVLILVFIAGRYWKKKESGSKQFQDRMDAWDDKVEDLANQRSGKVAPNEVQNQRAKTLQDAFQYFWGNFSVPEKLR